MEESAIKRRHREIMEGFGKDLVDTSAPIVTVNWATLVLFAIVLDIPVHDTNRWSLSAVPVIASVGFLMLDSRYRAQVRKLKSQLVSSDLQRSERRHSGRGDETGPTLAEILSLLLLALGFLSSAATAFLLYFKFQEPNPIPYGWVLIAAPLILLHVCTLVHYWWKVRPMIRELMKAQHLPS